MTPNQVLETFYQEVAPLAGYSPPSARFYFPWLYDGAPIEGGRVLEIGGGRGIYSLYSACRGARRTVCLEPVLDGSQSDMFDQFQRLQARLPGAPVDFVLETIQDFDPGDETFDVILMHNSINHLDEPACIDLHRDADARQQYLEIFSKIARLSAPGAHLIAVDLSPRNLFAALGLTNPIAPSIEWEKHQPPHLWADLLEQCDFSRRRVRWGTRRRKHAFLRFFLNSAPVAYLTDSRFCLDMVRSS